MSNVIEYVFNSLGWSLVGFVLGWVVASLRSDVTQIREAVMHEEQPHEQHNAPQRQVDVATRVLGVLVALLAIFTVVQGVISARRDRGIVECQTRFNTEFAEVTTRRSQLADQDRDALQNMLLTIYRAQDDAAARKRAFVHWVKTTEANRRERAENPLPELPKGDCK